LLSGYCIEIRCRLNRSPTISYQDDESQLIVVCPATTASAYQLNIFHRPARSSLLAERRQRRNLLLNLLSAAIPRVGR
jgi:hypothetical protein